MSPEDRLGQAFRTYPDDGRLLGSMGVLSKPRSESNISKWLRPTSSSGEAHEERAQSRRPVVSERLQRSPHEISPTCTNHSFDCRPTSSPELQRAPVGSFSMTESEIYIPKWLRPNGFSVERLQPVGNEDHGPVASYTSKNQIGVDDACRPRAKADIKSASLPSLHSCLPVRQRGSSRQTFGISPKRCSRMQSRGLFQRTKAVKESTPSPMAATIRENLGLVGNPCEDEDKNRSQSLVLSVDSPEKAPYQESCKRRGLLPKFARPAMDALSENYETMDLAGLGVGDEHLSSLLGDGDLVPTKKIRHWCLRDTRLTSKGVMALAASLSEVVESLDVARNRVGARGSAALAVQMDLGLLSGLRRLDLSVNSLRGDAAEVLANALINCPVLVRLELNHNKIQTGDALGNLVARHGHLTRLGLRTNLLSGAGVAPLFKGVLSNARAGGRIADIDVAWNGIMDANSLMAAEAIANALGESVTLYHLDLSYNSLDAPCCAIIGNALRDNHHLYGLHMVGNSATIDADGFLTPLEEKRMVPPSPVASRSLTVARFGDPVSTPTGRFAGLRRGLFGHEPDSLQRKQWTDDDILHDRDVLESQSGCWACEHWERLELEWPLRRDEPTPQAVWAFTSLDGFRRGLRLRLAPDSSRFVVARMVPPGCRLSVIFQVDSALKVAPNMEIETLDKAAEIQLRACTELPKLNPPPDQDVVVRREIEASGVLETEIVLRLDRAGVIGSGMCTMAATAPGFAGQRVVLLDAPDGGPAVQMPRVTEKEFKVTRSKPRPIRKAFWSAYRTETANAVRECFLSDWSRAKVSRLISEEELSDVQQVVESEYRKIIAIYRFLSSMGVSEKSGFGVSQIEASDMWVSVGLVDCQTTKISDVDRLMIAAKVLPPCMKNANVVVRSDTFVVRHQLLELVVRIAHQRFLQPGVCRSMVESVRRVLAALHETGSKYVEEIQAFFSAFHTDSVDDVFKAHSDLLHAVYLRFSGRVTPPGLPRFMSLNEFQDFLEAADAYDSEFQMRKAAYAFRIGLMTQAEESLSTRFQEMTVVEFFHAIGATVFFRAGFEPRRMAALCEQFIKCNVARVLPRAAKHKQFE